MGKAGCLIGPVSPRYTDEIYNFISLIHNFILNFVLLSVFYDKLNVLRFIISLMNAWFPRVLENGN